MKDPAFLFYYKDFLVDTASWSAQYLGWYIRLLCHQAEHGSLPDNVDDLFKLAGAEYSEYESFSVGWKRTLVAKFGADDIPGRIFNRKLRGVMQKRAVYSNNQKLRGLRGAYTKKLKSLTNEIGDIPSFLNELITEEFLNFNEKERSVRFKRMLEAYKVNVNVIVNKEEEKRKEEFEEKTISENKFSDRWSELEDGLAALKSNDLRFHQLFAIDERFIQMKLGMEFWLEKWSVSLDKNKDSQDWRTWPWQRLSSAAKSYLMSVWASKEESKTEENKSMDFSNVNS